MRDSEIFAKFKTANPDWAVSTLENKGNIEVLISDALSKDKTF